MVRDWNIESMILFEDKDVLVCHKKAGIPVQAAGFGKMDLECALKNYLAMNNPGKMPYLAVIHRLDQPVEGVLVFAKQKSAAADLNKQLTGNQFEKKYLAVSKGKSPEKEGQFVDYLIKNGKTNTSRIAKVSESGAKEARLHYNYMQEKNGRYLYQIDLETGRHHQIRVQMAAHGMALVGDRKYGDEADTEALALCAYSLSFRHPTKKKKMVFRVNPDGEAFKGFEK